MTSSADLDIHRGRRIREHQPTSSIHTKGDLPFGDAGASISDQKGAAFYELVDSKHYPLKVQKYCLELDIPTSIPLVTIQAAIDVTTVQGSGCGCQNITAYSNGACKPCYHQISGSIHAGLDIGFTVGGTGLSASVIVSGTVSLTAPEAHQCPEMGPEEENVVEEIDKRAAKKEEETAAAEKEEETEVAEKEENKQESGNMIERGAKWVGNKAKRGAKWVGNKAGQGAKDFAQWTVDTARQKKAGFKDWMNSDNWKPKRCGFSALLSRWFDHFIAEKIWKSRSFTDEVISQLMSSGEQLDAAQDAMDEQQVLVENIKNAQRGNNFKFEPVAHPLYVMGAIAMTRHNEVSQLAAPSPRPLCKLTTTAPKQKQRLRARSCTLRGLLTIGYCDRSSLPFPNRVVMVYS